MKQKPRLVPLRSRKLLWVASWMLRPLSERRAAFFSQKTAWLAPKTQPVNRDAAQAVWVTTCRAQNANANVQLRNITQRSRLGGLQGRRGSERAERPQFTRRKHLPFAAWAWFLIAMTTEKPPVCGTRHTHSRSTCTHQQHFQAIN